MPANKNYFPSLEDVRQFVKDHPEPNKLSKREIGRAFSIPKSQLGFLNVYIKQLKTEGTIPSRQRPIDLHTKILKLQGVIDQITLNDHGVVLSIVRHNLQKIISKTADVIIPKNPASLALKRHDTVQLQLHETTTAPYQGSMHTPTTAPIGAYKTGLFRAINGKAILEVARQQDQLRIYPVSRTSSYLAKNRDWVVADISTGKRPIANIIQSVGSANNALNLSKVACLEYDFPVDFTEEAEALANTSVVPVLGARDDLRHIPFVTIDGADARDFDDAVWAVSDQRPGNKNGWQIIVAIADVAHYVQPGSALDLEARARGNSIYFPDRVVPMLPFALSGGLCSLKPHVDRASLAVHLRIDDLGNLVSYRFSRALIRSNARLTYEQVQQAYDGKPDTTIKPLLPSILSLYGAYHSLLKNRKKRKTLELNIAERHAVLSETGLIKFIGLRQSLASHQLIEEMMICANVAAAKVLQENKQPAIYRNHLPPDLARINDLVGYLKKVNFEVAKPGKIDGDFFNNILEKLSTHPLAEIIAELCLRTQSQANYSANNHGHFGLGLPEYTHFTSPIRRYADLIVHRALISTLGLGNDGLSLSEANDLPIIAQAISISERQAATAERLTLDRLTCLHYEKMIGHVFTARIVQIMDYGIFIRIIEDGVEGFIPNRLLGHDTYQYHIQEGSIIGMKSRKKFSLVDKLSVRLESISLIDGKLLFGVVVTAKSNEHIPAAKSNRGRRKQRYR